MKTLFFVSTTGVLYLCWTRCIYLSTPSATSKIRLKVNSFVGTTGLNSDFFSFSDTSCLIKANRTQSALIPSWTWEKWWIHGLCYLKHRTSSKIWTRVNNFISYDDNRYAMRSLTLSIYVSVCLCLFVWVLWHINLCTLFNAKSIFIQINSFFQTIQVSKSTQFNCQKRFYFKQFSLIQQF